MEDRVYAQLYELEDSHWWFAGRRAVIDVLLQGADLPPAPRILDAGCGTGRQLQEYARLGSVEGFDPSPVAVEFCHARGLGFVRQGTLAAPPYDDESFDLLCASDVLEHVGDDSLALRELRRLARPGAHLLVTAPAYRWLWSPHDDAHHHFRRYTQPQLTERASASGWRPTRATYFNSALLAPIAAVRLAQRLRPPAPAGSDYERTPAALSAALAGVMRAEARLIGSGRSLPVGVSIGLVCRAA
jgi:SAM-dependent methyltransferase